MNKAETVYTAKQLEKTFEWYYNEILPLVSSSDSQPSRHYKLGRIYGFDGTYGDQVKEDRYQAWIKDFNLVESIVEQYFWNKDFYDNIQGSDAACCAAVGAEDVVDWTRPYNLEVDEDDAKPGEPMDDDDIIEPRVVMRIVARPTPLEEGEIVEEPMDIYPDDLLDPEPFIRAHVISHEGAMVMEEMISEDLWSGAFSTVFVDPARYL